VGPNGHWREDKISVILPPIQPQFLGYLVPTLATVTTELIIKLISSALHAFIYVFNHKINANYKIRTSKHNNNNNNNNNMAVVDKIVARFLLL
jgi:hypothetical protein